MVVLSEPTRGVDVGAKSEIYGFMQDLAEQGRAILMISSELPELLGVADRILVMFRGRIRGEFDARSATEEEVAHVALTGALAEMAGMSTLVSIRLRQRRRRASAPYSACWGSVGSPA